MAGDSAERVDESSIGAKFKKLWFYYIFQSFLAVISIFILVFLLGEERVVLISAMGATSFIVFAMPQEVSAKTRNVVGGHLVGLGSGVLFYFLGKFFGIPFYLSCPMTVGVAIFIMVALDLEHPPAAGTALAVVINEVTPDVFVTIMLSALVLSQIRYYLRHHLKDLV